MELINQRHDNDCTIACLAMYAEKSYDEIIEVMKSLGLKYPLSTDEDIKILKELGHSPIWLKQWVWQAKGILSVPSLNIPTANHVVIWTGNDSNGHVLDPQTGNKDKKCYTDEMVLGNEYFGWSGFLTDANDDVVRMFAQMELDTLQQALNK